MWIPTDLLVRRRWFFFVRLERKFHKRKLWKIIIYWLNFAFMRSVHRVSHQTSPWMTLLSRRLLDGRCADTSISRAPLALSLTASGTSHESEEWFWCCVPISLWILNRCVVQRSKRNFQNANCNRTKTLRNIAPPSTQASKLPGRDTALRLVWETWPGIPGKCDW